jgi:Ca2+-binding RTX toxin-like protein
MTTYTIPGIRIRGETPAYLTLTIESEGDAPRMTWTGDVVDGVPYRSPTGEQEIEIRPGGFGEADVFFGNTHLPSLSFDHVFAGDVRTAYGTHSYIGFIVGSRHERDSSGNPLYDENGHPIYSMPASATTWYFPVGGDPVPDLSDPAILARFVASAGDPLPVSTNRVRLDVSPFVTEDSSADILGTPQSDGLRGTGAGEVIRALASDDVVTAGRGADRLYGGSGDDNLSGNGGGDRIWGADGADRISGDGGSDYAFGGAGKDTIYGGGGSDSIDTGTGRDRAYGGRGDDVIAGQGAGLYDGGAGDDILSNSGGRRAILRGGADNDTLYHSGTHGGRLFGGSGDDTIHGGAGADIARGDHGADTLFGGGGRDQLRGGSGDDTLVGGAGADNLYSGSGNDRLYGGIGADDFQIELNRGEAKVVGDFDLAEDTLFISSLVLRPSNLAAAAETIPGGMRFTRDGTVLVLEGVFDAQTVLADANIQFGGFDSA